MTPLIGILIAVLAGLLAPNVRALVWSVLVAMVAATAVQTWDLDDGLGSNPPSTVHQIAYWIAQLIIISVIVGVALGVYRLRQRRAAAQGRSMVRPAFSGRRGAAVVAWSVLAMSSVMVGAVLVIGHTRANRGHGASDMPWTGVLGLAIGLIAIVGLGLAVWFDTRSTRRHSVV